MGIPSYTPTVMNNIALPQTWDGTSTDARLFDAIEFQIGSLTGTGPWTPQRSLDGSNWDACSAWRGTTEYTSLTASQNGMIFTASGRGYFRLYSATGGDTVTATIRAS